jgi:hypothetical protein
MYKVFSFHIYKSTINPKRQTLTTNPFIYNLPTSHPSKLHPFLQLNLNLKPRLPRRLRILRIIRLQLRQNTLHIILPLSQRLRSRRILGVVRLERRQDAREIVAHDGVAAPQFDFHGGRRGVGVFGVVLAQGFENRGDVGVGVGLGG